MAGAHVQTVTAGGSNTTSVTTGGVTTTSGNLLVATVGGWRNGAQVTHVVTDSKIGNVWLENASSPQSANVNTRSHQYYVGNITGGASHTFTSTAALATYQTLFVSEFSGMATSSPIDKTAGTTGTSTTPSSGATATRSQADEILVGSVGTADGINAGTMSAGSGYTIPTNGSNTNFNNYVSATDYQIVSAAGTDAATFTISSEAWSCIIGTYKVAGAGGGQSVVPIIMALNRQRGA